jgi:signal transduction histidine kinase
VGAALAAGVPALVLLVAITTWLMTGYALRPVEVLRRQAAEISAAAVDGRLAMPASRDEVYRLAGTLNEMLCRLQAASLAQRRFVADAAHELRSPLTALRTQLDTVEVHPGDESPAGLARYLRADVDRLQSLVDNLLTLARTGDPGWQQPERVVDLDEIVFDELRSLPARAGLRVDASAVSGGRVLGDPEGLRRVVRNVLDNAARHAMSGIEVELRAGEEEVVLAVSDDGPGVPSAQRDQIFDRFHRLDQARSRDVGGAGLGLAIVREVVTAHHGRVAVEDSPNGLPGARFVVRLPVVAGAGR